MAPTMKVFILMLVLSSVVVPAKMDFDEEEYEMTLIMPTEETEDLGSYSCRPAMSYNTTSGPTCNLETAEQIHYSVYLIGTCISLLTCLTALTVYIKIHKNIFTSRSEPGRNVTRHFIHCNFIISFVIRDVIFLYLLAHIIAEKVPPKTSEGDTFVIYTTVVSFYWMFAEGLWLYLGVAKALEYQAYKCMKIKLFLIGWLVPGLLIAIWAIAIKFHASNPCNFGNMYWTLPGILCILVPIYIVLLANLIMMIRVLYKVNDALHDSRHSAKTNQRLAKSTLLLSFLLGMNFAIPSVIIPTLPESQQCAVEIVRLLSDTVSSFQGFFVAMFFVLRSKDVLEHLGRTSGHQQIPDVEIDLRTRSTALTRLST